MRKCLFFLLAVLMAGALLPQTAHAAQAAPEVAAKACVLMEAGSGRLLYEKDATTPMLIASTTKIMTALVVTEHCKMDEIVEILPEYVGVEGSSMYLLAGEKLTVRELLCGLLLASGNDAAVALACHTAGGIAPFAALMNQKAASMGLSATSFQNPHGLDAEAHHSSAADLALIMAEAMKNETFVEISGTKSATVAGRTLKNHNKLLWDYPDVVAGKTGYTKSAGRSLVSCAEKGGVRLVCVTLSDPCDWEDHAALYTWGFTLTRTENTAAPRSRNFHTLPVVSGVSGTVAVRPAKAVTVTLFGDETLESKVILPRFVYAGVLQGERAGYVVYTVGGQIVAVIDLVYASTVLQDQKVPLSIWEKFGRLFI